MHDDHLIGIPIYIKDNPGASLEVSEFIFESVWSVLKAIAYNKEMPEYALELNRPGEKVVIHVVVDKEVVE